MDHGILIIGYYLGCAFLKEYVGDLDPQSTPPPPPPQKKKKVCYPMNSVILHALEVSGGSM